MSNWKKVLIVLIVAAIATGVGLLIYFSVISGKKDNEDQLLSLSETGIVSVQQSKKMSHKGDDESRGHLYRLRIGNSTSVNYFYYKTIDSYEQVGKDYLIKFSLPETSAFNTDVIYHAKIERDDCWFRSSSGKTYVNHNYGTDYTWHLYFTVDADGKFHTLENSYTGRVASVTTRYPLEKVLTQKATINTDNYLVVTLTDGAEYSIALPQYFVDAFKTEKVGDYNASITVGGVTLSHDYKVVGAKFSANDEFYEDRLTLDSITAGDYSELHIAKTYNGAAAGLSLADFKNVKRLTVPFDLPANALAGFDQLEDLAITTTGARVFQLFGSALPASLKTIRIVNSKKIPAYFFMRCEQVENLIIPNEVTTFDDNWDDNLTGVKRIVIPGTKVILSNYPSLREVEIANGSTEISNGFLFNHNYVEKVFMPDTLQYLKVNSLCNLPRVKGIRFSNRLKEIGHDVFDGLTMPELNIPATVTYVDLSAFNGCKFNKITFGPLVTEIAQSAFGGCTNLKTLICTSPNVKIQSNGEFLKDSPVETLGFAGNNKLSKIIYNTAALKNLTIYGDVCNEYAQDFTAAQTVNVTLADSCHAIGDSAFRSTNLLTSLDTNQVTRMGGSVFSGNYYLTNLTTHPCLTKVGSYVFNSCKYVTGKKMAIIGDGILAYYDSSMIAGGVIDDIPDTVKQIAPYVLISGYHTITIPASVTLIDQTSINSSSLQMVILQGRTQVNINYKIFDYLKTKDHDYLATLVIKMNIDDLDWYTTADSWKNYTSKFKPM